jgi:hypothetical protein
VFNCALLKKWVWCYMHETKARGRLGVDSKYVVRGVGGVLMSFLGHMA